LDVNNSIANETNEETPLAASNNEVVESWKDDDNETIDGDGGSVV